jgi:REP element-mobilizing transposase RayT
MFRPDFVAFDECKAVRIYQRNLPHWRQEGATYFVTFRLGDSIPQGVLDQWEYEKRLWLTSRGIPVDGEGWYRPFEQLPELARDGFHKHFNRLFHAALDDGLGACYLNWPECLAIVQQRLLQGDGDQYQLGDFVVMPNHVHLLITPVPGSALERLLKRVKGATARRCNQLLDRTGQFWQPDSYDHIVRTLDQLLHFRQYIADNPVKCGLPGATNVYRADWMDAWYS